MEMNFFGFTIKQLIMYGGGLLGILIFLSILSSVFSKKDRSEHTQIVQCECGWQGKVSRYAGRCPACNGPIGEQKSM